MAVAAGGCRIGLRSAEELVLDALLPSPTRVSRQVPVVFGFFRGRLPLPACHSEVFGRKCVHAPPKTLVANFLVVSLCSGRRIFSINRFVGTSLSESGSSLFSKGCESRNSPGIPALAYRARWSRQRLSRSGEEALFAPPLSLFVSAVARATKNPRVSSGHDPSSASAYALWPTDPQKLPKRLVGSFTFFLIQRSKNFRCFLSSQKMQPVVQSIIAVRSPTAKMCRKDPLELLSLSRTRTPRKTPKLYKRVLLHGPVGSDVTPVTNRVTTCQRGSS